MIVRRIVRPIAVIFAFVLLCCVLNYESKLTALKEQIIDSTCVEISDGFVRYDCSETEAISITKFLDVRFWLPGTEYTLDSIPEYYITFDKDFSLVFFPPPDWGMARCYVIQKNPYKQLGYYSIPTFIYDSISSYSNVLLSDV